MKQVWLAEFIGTAGLLATVVGSGLMAESLADGNQALALLANSLATALMLAVLITVFRPLSGAHFNPAVSLFLSIAGELPRRQLPVYLSAQAVGAVLGVVLAHLMWELPALQWAQQTRYGSGVWVSEMVATAGLLFVIIAAIRRCPEQIPWLVGAYIGAAYWFTASTSFANPAVTLARTLTDSFTGIAAGSAPAFLLAQLLGAGLGTMAAWYLTAAPARSRSAASR